MVDRHVLERVTFRAARRYGVDRPITGGHPSEKTGSERLTRDRISTRTGRFPVVKSPGVFTLVKMHAIRPRSAQPATATKTIITAHVRALLRPLPPIPPVEPPDPS